MSEMVSWVALARRLSMSCAFSQAFVTGAEVAPVSQHAAFRRAAIMIVPNTLYRGVSLFLFELVSLNSRAVVQYCTPGVAPSRECTGLCRFLVIKFLKCNRFIYHTAS